ncbi:alcohol dehydrogenase catalytic domain-containing protein [Dactylosporangium sp. NPDC051484]|uniref:alcohol dehydrogenase catalytic domain-containing protein n=1 Tax=Dactylosporangium sp. NPDC051484 TaxID=3154942 RepID=UPI00344EE734
MRAIRWHGRLDVRLDDIAEPKKLNDGELLLRVLYCGICGTDIEEFRQGPRLIPTEQPHRLTGRSAPLTLGHEFAGEVVDTRGDTPFARGDVVAVDGNVSCGSCYWCLRGERTLCPDIAQYGLKADGGLAEYVVVAAGTCVRLPPDADRRIGALAEPMSVAVRAVRRSRLALGATVAVVGAGPVGLLVAEVARAAGAAYVVIVDPRADRRELALSIGADEVFEATAAIHEKGAGVIAEVGPDLVFECAGQPGTAADAIATVRRGGRVVTVGRMASVSLDQGFMAGEKEVIAALTHDRVADYEVGLRMMLSGRVVGTDIVTECISLEQAAASYFQPAAERQAIGKALVHP